MEEGLTDWFRPKAGAAALAREVRRLGRSTRGNVALMAALCLFGLSSIVGAAITFTQMTTVSSELQDRVDALALTSAVAVRDGAADDELASRADAAFAQVSSGVAGSGGATVSVVSPTSAEVEATMFRDVQVVLGGLFGMESVRVERSARAIALAGDPVCLHVLSSNQPAAFSRRGASTLEAANCVAQVNSVSDQALDSRGAGGGVNTLRTLVSGGGAAPRGFSPEPEFGAPSVADPYASRITWPSAGSCDSSGYRVKRSRLSIAPGVICGDLDLQTGAEVVLGAGVHVITGDLTMGAGASLVAEGATLVFVGETSRIDINSQSEARFVAPTQGPWDGIAVAVKPQPAEQVSSIQGGGDLELTGVLYMPSQQLHLTGGGALGEPTDDLRMIVVNRLDLSGNGRVWLNGARSPVTTASGVRLVE